MAKIECIGTGASWTRPSMPGMRPDRIGTLYFYKEAEIQEHIQRCEEMGVGAYIRRRKLAKTEVTHD